LVLATGGGGNADSGFASADEVLGNTSSSIATRTLDSASIGSINMGARRQAFRSWT